MAKLQKSETKAENPEPPKSTKPQWEEGRYITLMGDPIKADGKAFTAITESDMHSMIAGLIGGGGLGLLKGDTVSFMVFMTMLGGIVNKYRKSIYFDDLVEIFGEAMNNKCIDTKPDGRIKSDPQDIILAERASANMRSRRISGIYAASVICAFTCYSSFYAGGVGAAIAGISAASQTTQAINRFNNIVEKKWIINPNWPEPKKAEEPKKTSGIVVPFSKPSME